MKKCPFCAEKIQAEAIKCKHCGEWLNKEDLLKTADISEEQEPLHKEYTETVKEQKINRERTPCFDESCIGIINEQGICTECKRTKQEIESGIQSKPKVPEKLVPIKKPKLGWGLSWVILILIFIAAEKTINADLSRFMPASPNLAYFIPILVYIATAFVYFKLRRFFIGNTNDRTRIWPSSLKAGVLAFFFMVFLEAITIFIVRSLL